MGNRAKNGERIVDIIARARVAVKIGKEAHGSLRNSTRRLVGQSIIEIGEVRPDLLHTEEIRRIHF